jgi:hypothetical protein
MLARLNEWRRGLWAQHGTKVIGYAGAALSTLSLLDHETIDLIGSTCGPVWGPRVTHGLAIFGGVMTVRRGRQNSRPQEP